MCIQLLIYIVLQAFSCFYSQANEVKQNPRLHPLQRSQTIENIPEFLRLDRERKEQEAKAKQSPQMPALTIALPEPNPDLQPVVSLSDNDSPSLHAPLPQPQPFFLQQMSPRTNPSNAAQPNK